MFIISSYAFKDLEQYNLYGMNLTADIDVMLVFCYFRLCNIHK